MYRQETRGTAKISILQFEYSSNLDNTFIPCAILNYLSFCFQGIFISIIYCFMNSEVSARDAYRCPVQINNIIPINGFVTTNGNGMDSSVL